MAHQLEIAGGQASFAYSGKIGSAWHKLGVELPDLSDADEILAACRGDYMVHRDKLLAVDPTGTGEAIETDAYMTWRERYNYDEEGTPTSTSKQVLGIVGSDYKTIQNRSVVGLGLTLAGMAPGEQGIDCAGVMYDGRRFFVTIPLPELVIDPEGIADRYGRNLVLVTGHDATQSLEIVNGFTRAVCANTVAAALRGSQHKVKIRHVGNTEATMAEVKKGLGLMLSADETFAEIAHTMLDMEGSWSLLERVADKLWPLKDGANDREKTNHHARLTKLQGIYDSDRGAGGVGHNRYAIFQTLTEYMEHDQHIVGKNTQYNRAQRAVASPGFNTRVHTLAKVLQQKQPVRELAGR